MYSTTRFKKTALCSAVLFALGLNGVILGTDATQAASEVCIGSDASTPTSTNTASANFTMLDGGGATVGGTNDVAMTWDGTVYNNSSDYAGPGSTANVTAASTTAFFGYVWTAHDIQVFLPGSYSFDTTTGGGNPEAGMLNVTVPAGMLGMHMLFDWNGNNNIDVFVVAAPNSAFGTGVVRSGAGTTYSGANNCDAGVTTNCLWDGATNVIGHKPTANQVWMLASTDGNADGHMGIPMATGGPFAGFNANFNFPGVFTNLQNTCATFVDTIPDAFSFTSVTNAAVSTLYTSDAITVSGLASSATTDISVTNGEYAISTDGGTSYSAFTSTANTPAKVGNGHMVKVRGTSPAVDGQTTTVALNIGGITGTFAISTPAVAGAQGSNFTMLDPNGGVVGGTNDVIATWDGTFNIDENDPVTNATAHMTISSVTPFFSFPWTAHHIRVFGPGTYTIDTTCTVAQLEAGTAACNNPLQGTPGGPAGSPQTQRYYTFTVGAGQIGVHMLFDWNTTTNIDVVDIMNQDQAFGPSQMYTGSRACNNAATLWDLMSTDWDGDGQNGAAMVDGPFQGFKANFNIRLPGSPVLACSAYTPSVNVADPSGAGGCSIGSRPSNGIERGDWWLVAGFLVWLGGIRLRFKRRLAKS